MPDLDYFEIMSHLATNLLCSQAFFFAYAVSNSFNYQASVANAKSAGKWDFQFPNHKPILLVQIALRINVLYINILYINAISDRS